MIFRKGPHLQITNIFNPKNELEKIENEEKIEIIN